ncbi:MAG: hypothetical protein WBX15_17755 [Thermoanaerobaculia bacterium]
MTALAQLHVAVLAATCAREDGRPQSFIDVINILAAADPSDIAAAVLVLERAGFVRVFDRDGRTWVRPQRTAWIVIAAHLKLARRGTEYAA